MIKLRDEQKKEEVSTMNDIRSKVMTAANRLVKGGMRRSLAMIKAWALAKASALRIRVRGTAHRQSEQYIHLIK